MAKKFGMIGHGGIYDRKSGHFLYERYQITPVVKEALRELFHDKFATRTRRSGIWFS